jgi:uncharacterized phiE125 gp8 family phage protein
MAFIDDMYAGLLPTPQSRLPKGTEMVCATPPTVEPVTVAELKDVMRFPQSITLQDANLARLIKSARRDIEALTNTLMLTQTWTQIQNAVGRQIQILRKPVQSITSIDVIPNFDVDTWQQVPSDHYITSGMGASIDNAPIAYVLARATWPVSRGWKGFRVTFKGGFGDAATSVPEDLKDAVLTLAAHRFENPDGAGPERMNATTTAVFGSIPPDIKLKVERFMEWR